MSEETFSQKSKGQRGSKPSKNVKVYEPKIVDSKEVRNEDRSEGSSQKRANDGFIRQVPRYSEDKQLKESGYGKGSMNNKGDHPARKRRQNYIKFSKKEVLENHVAALQPRKEFLELIDDNPQIFVKDKLNPLNIGFQSYDIKNDECINPKRSLNASKKESYEQQNVLQGYGKEKKDLDFWDVGTGKEAFDVLDMKEVDAELRGMKKVHASKAIDSQAESTVDQECQNAETQDNSAEEREKHTESYENDDEGEFSNIDVLFEQKLKSNPKSISQGEDDDDEAHFKGSTAHSQEEEEADIAPLWGSFGADEIKKNASNMNNLFVQANEKPKADVFPFSLEGTFDLLLNESNKAEQQHQRHQQQQYQQRIGGGITPKKTPNKIFPLYHHAEDSYDENSTDVSLNLTPHNELNWSFNKTAEIPNGPNFRQHQQQQMYPRQPQPQEVMKQAMPKAINLSTCLGNTTTPQVKAQVAPEKPVQYVPMQNFPGFSKLATPAPSNPNAIGLTKQIPQAKDCLFKFFSGGNDYEKKFWFYKDLQNKVRGPFSAKEMDEWHNAKYLPMDLLITYGDNKNFRSLSDLIKYRESFKTEAPQQKPVQPTTPARQGPGINLSTLTSIQLQDLTKNPEFIEYARASNLNLNQLMYSIKQREANEKPINSPKAWGYNANSLENQGYYPISSPDNSRNCFGPNPQSASKTSSFQPGTTPDFAYNQGMYNNYNNIDCKQTNMRTSNQGYPIDLPQQTSFSPTYPTNAYATTPMTQGSTPQRIQSNFNYYGHVGSPGFMSTDNYKSFIAPNGANSGNNQFA